MALSDLVNIQISLASAGVVARGFGVPMILGVHTRFDDSALYRDYTDPSEMLEDGFLAADQEYIDASLLMSQALKPSRFVIGRRLTPTAQVSQVTITSAVDSTAYTFTLNGRTVTYTSGGSATVETIEAGLIAAVAALSPPEPVTAASGGTGVVQITANEAGTPFTISESDTRLTLATGTANVGIGEDLAAIRAAGATWYATIPTSRGTGTILTAAAWTEANSRDVPTIQLAQTSEATSRTVAYGSTLPDLGSRLKALGYTRTAWIWHSDDAEGLVAGWAGGLLPYDPGLETWALKTIVGVDPDTYSTTQKSNVIGTAPLAGKNGNIYYALTESNNITERGTMASGDWIDLIRFVDFLKFRMSEGIVETMLEMPKVPFTDKGIGAIAARVRAVLQDAEDAGKLSTDPKYTMVVPRASAISSANRRARNLSPGITFACQTSGAIHEASVTGIVAQ